MCKFRLHTISNSQNVSTFQKNKMIRFDIFDNCQHWTVSLPQHFVFRNVTQWCELCTICVCKFRVFRVEKLALLACGWEKTQTPCRNGAIICYACYRIVRRCDQIIACSYWLLVIIRITKIMNTKSIILSWSSSWDRFLFFLKTHTHIRHINGRSILCIKPMRLTLSEYLLMINVQYTASRV